MASDGSDVAAGEVRNRIALSDRILSFSGTRICSLRHRFSGLCLKSFGRQWSGLLGFLVGMKVV